MASPFEKSSPSSTISSNCESPLTSKAPKNKIEQQKKKNSIPRNCITSKNRRKALSENKNISKYLTNVFTSVYYNII